MSFLQDSTQETIDMEIMQAKLEYDVHVYESQMLDQKRKLAELKKSELQIRARMQEISAHLESKKAELRSL